MLKIVSHSVSNQETHARDLLRALDVDNMRHPQSVRPRGVPAHRALHAIRCEECAETYWSADEFAAHRGCKGEPPAIGYS